MHSTRHSKETRSTPMSRMPQAMGTNQPTDQPTDGRTKRGVELRACDLKKKQKKKQMSIACKQCQDHYIQDQCALNRSCVVKKVLFINKLFSTYEQNRSSKGRIMCFMKNQHGSCTWFQVLPIYNQFALYSDIHVQSIKIRSPTKRLYKRVCPWVGRQVCP